MVVDVLRGFLLQALIQCNQSVSVRDGLCPSVACVYIPPSPRSCFWMGSMNFCPSICIFLAGVERFFIHIRLDTTA